MRKSAAGRTNGRTNAAEAVGRTKSHCPANRGRIEIEGGELQGHHSINRHYGHISGRFLELALLARDEGMRKAAVGSTGLIQEGHILSLTEVNQQSAQLQTKP